MLINQRETWGIKHRLMSHIMYPVVWWVTVLVLVYSGILGEFDMRIFIILSIAGFFSGLMVIWATYGFLKR